MSATVARIKHQLLSASLLAGFLTALYGIQYAFFHQSGTPKDLIDHAWQWGSLVWLAAAPTAVVSLVGLFWYRHPVHLHSVQPVPQTVSFRIVSRGTNPEALRKTVQACLDAMDKAPLFPFIVEVVTDEQKGIDLNLPDDPRVFSIIVPKSYQTKAGTKFKARALHYALYASPLPYNDWLVHLDEESHPTVSAIRGIAEAIAEEETSGRLRVGQGAILYHRNLRQNPFLTLCDTVRTGDDFARYYFQNRIGITLFGLHGSWILVRNDVEKSVGFDFGPEGSITEDAFWALKLMERGHRSRWVNGYVEEQATQGVKDFVKQRQRWFQGLLLTRKAPVALRWKVSLFASTLAWGVAPAAVLYTLARFFYGFQVNPAITALANLSMASFLTLYIIGLNANLAERNTRLHKRAALTVAQIAVAPAVGILEATAVAYGIFGKTAGFHVVKK